MMDTLNYIDTERQAACPAVHEDRQGTAARRVTVQAGRRGGCVAAEQNGVP
jgi:hypothetical protein